MTASDRLFVTPPGVKLGPLDIIADGKARNFVLEMAKGRFHGFIVRRGQTLFGYVDQCPHAGLPLARSLDDYLTPDGSMVACAWHGALFEAQSGRCVGGPGHGQSLRLWPVTTQDGQIVTV